jgi:tripartite-type tricarboxylate transporter receptor subunit TctC
VGGPKGLPDSVVRKLEDAYRKGMKDPEFVKVMERMQTPIWYMDHASLTKYAEECFLETAKIFEKVKAEEDKKTQ